MARGRERLWQFLCVTVLALTLGGIAGAAVPDAGGVIHACYNASLGSLRIIDTEVMTQRGCRGQE
jgi:hypothetical protein